MRYLRLGQIVRTIAVCLVMLAGRLVFAQAERVEQPDARLASIDALQVEPKGIVLDAGNRRQQIQVTARAGDRLIDVTGQCEIRSSDPRVASVEGTTLLGGADGKATLIARMGPVETSVPIAAKNLSGSVPIHFANDVSPILTKLGCTSGGCHGKASGQGGFKLSIFGFDPDFDYQAIVKQSRGRRLFFAAPEKSLLIEKATARVPHGGGRRVEPGGADEATLLDWIRQGSPVGSAEVPTLVRLEVRPNERVSGFGASQQVLATAIYSDDSRRDVTHASIYTSSAARLAEVDQQGLVRMGKVPGQAAINLNYMGQVAVVRLLVPRPGSTASFPATPDDNEIDKLVWTKLRAMGIVPSPLTDDATFLRRLFIDAIGTLPTPEEVRAFLRDGSPDKRSRWIDRVLERDEFADYWALKWSDILLVDRATLGERGAFELHRWLRSQFARNRPYDEWVRELITATGISGRDGPVNFFRAVTTPEDIGRTVSQAFLGVRIDCAQCHHHPFDRWSQDDFYALAGFFNGIERKSLGEDRQLIYHSGLRETRIPLSERPVKVRPLGSGPAPTLDDADPRVVLATWMTKPENPWFTRLVANRLWKHYLGRGLVEPEDDLRSTNPSSNEPLFDYLAGEVVSSGFDLKALMRLILNSRVYQLSSRANETNHDDDQFFSHHYVKRLAAEVLLDAVCQVTGAPEHYPGRPNGTRAIELWDNRAPSYFLDIFGRPLRKTPCECARSSEPTMSQALHLLNAPEIGAKITVAIDGSADVLASKFGRERLVEELCLAALGRPPAVKEQAIANELFGAAPRGQAAEDFLWVLLNSHDFLFVH